MAAVAVECRVRENLPESQTDGDGDEKEVVELEQLGLLTALFPPAECLAVNTDTGLAGIRTGNLCGMDTTP